MSETTQPMHEMLRDSYVRYALEVTRARALVSNLDGLKPVHRRILWAMQEERLKSDGPTRKVAKIVGRVIGDYHPHGDKAVADALVRLAQPWTMRVPLILSQGNFGSPDKDPAAAQRYIEAKLSPAGEMMLEDCIPQICEFTKNFDQTCDEPVHLASKFPNVLINGHEGIAVGFASDMPCHNPNEVCDAIKMFVDNPSATIDDLLSVMPGPDWPTGGIVFSEGVKKYYETGRGSVVLQGKVEIDTTGPKPSLVITELPYQVGATELREQISEVLASEENSVLSSTIDTVNNYSDSEKGLHIVIDLKATASPKQVLQELLKNKKIKLRTNVSINQTILFNTRPEQAPITKLIKTHIEHRRSIVTKRTEHLLAKAEDRLVVLEAYMKALKRLQEVIKLIERSSGRQEALQALIDFLSVTERQADAILQLQLQRLTGLEQEKLKEEHAEISKKVANYKLILKTPSMIDDIIKQELEEVKQTCGSPRMTRIIQGVPQEIQADDLLEEMDVCVMINADNTGKIVRGFSDEITKTEQERVIKVFRAKNTDYLVAFTLDGRYMAARLHTFDLVTRKSIGSNLFQCDSPIIKYCVVKGNPDQVVTILTRGGKIKRSLLKEYGLTSKKPLPAIKLNDGDLVADVQIHSQDGDYLIITDSNLAIRFPADVITPIARDTKGVVAVSKTAGTPIQLAYVGDGADYIVIVSHDGYGKKVPISEYNAQMDKGGKGSSTLTSKISRVIGAFTATDKDVLSLFVNNGRIAFRPVKDLRKHPRAARGDMLFQLILGQEFMKVGKLYERTD